MPVVVSVEHVGKQYRLGTVGAQSLHDAVRRWWARERGKPDPLAPIGDRRPRRTDAGFWALDDVSLEVEQGDVLGIVGRNGSGKSTLLKILSQVTAPTTGRIVIRGRVASLLEVGTGFHPDLTGRENVFLGGAMMGMTKAEIRRNLDRIVAFSECEAFIDTPVKRYSSGMYVRLAFAVAAHVEPDILIVDEVLAVGDAPFQRRCLARMREASREGRTVVFVSHNLPIVQSLCTRAVMLAHGRVAAIGSAISVVNAYLSTQSGDALQLGRPVDLSAAPRWGGSGDARFVEVTPYDPERPHAVGAFQGGNIGFRLRIEGDLAAARAVAVQIADMDDRRLVYANSLEIGHPLELEAPAVVELELVDLALRPGRYKVGYWLGAADGRGLDHVTDATMLDVLGHAGVPWTSAHDGGVFHCDFRVRTGRTTPALS
ncbi:MAG: polysaccharide ABC transporter ATP-binding protein [Vicinamibacterales bacterium]